MALTRDEVQKIAHLAKLRLTDDEVDMFSNQLGNILTFVEQLSEVDTDNVPETSQVTGLENVTQDDEVEVFGQEDQLLDCSPHPIEQHSIRIPKIL